ncbi:MAG: outer membrane beta-barrel protein [Saprospiraceae bacterium]
MKRLTYLLVLAFLGCAFVATAQGFMLSGKMLDQAGTEPLIGVNVVLLRAADSTQVAGTTTDVNGDFQFERLRPGGYVLRATYVGYQTLNQAITLERADKNLGNIKLEQAALELQSVTVEGAQIRTQQKGDTTEFNAAAFKVNPDATVEDLTRKMPGVTVENGQVKAQGEDVRRVTIDGREYFGDDATMALRNLPAEVVDKIQVFDRMSDQAQFSGFNDGNTEKALNIITRGNLKAAEFGKFYAGYGTDERFSAGGNYNIFRGDARISIVGLSNNINQQNFSSQDLLGVTSGNSGGGGMRGGMGGGGMRGGGSPGGWGNNPASNFMVGQQSGINTTHSFGLNYSDTWGKKLKFTGSYFFNNANNDTESRSQRETFLPEGGSQFYNEDNISENRNYNHRLNFRVEYAIDSNNTLILTPRLNFQNNRANSLVAGLTSLIGNELVNSLDNDRESNNNGYNFNNEILWQHRFGKMGRTLSVNLNTSISDREGEIDQYSLSEFYNQNVADSTQLLNQLTNTVSDGTTISTNITYTEPLGKNGQLSFTYNPSVNNNNSERLTNRFDEATQGYTQLDSILSNRFDNEITTQRGGLGYRVRFKTGNFNVGLNYQNVLLASDQTFPRTLDVQESFNNLLPNAMLEFRPNRTTNLRMFYRTFTQTPSVTQLQNVIDNSNPQFLSAGNPNLRQQFSHMLVTRYNRTNTQKATSFFAVVFLNKTDDFITNATTIAPRDTLLQDGVTLFRGAQLSQPVNIDGYWNVRSFVNYGLPVKGIKSNLNLNAGFTYTLTPGLINNRINEANTYNLSGGLVLSSNISEKLDFTLSYGGNYNIVENTLQPQLNNNFFYQNTGFRLNWLPAKWLVINTDLNHTLYTGLGEGFDQNFLLWNAGIGYRFLKNNVGEIRLNAFDLLGQNNSISRSVTESFIEDNITQVLTRYFMLTFTYNLRSFNLGGNNNERPPMMPGMPFPPRQ